jgi:predicted HicB family RNase H-like nuclease
MPVKQGDIQGYFNLRYPDKKIWRKIKGKADEAGISLTDLIWVLLTAWAEDRIEIKKEG